MFLVIGFIGFSYRAKKSSFKSNKVEFVIVSIASKGVKNSLFECINHTRTHFKDIPLTILVDEEAELSDELVQMSRSPVKVSTAASGGALQCLRQQHQYHETSFTIVVVPKNYRRDLIAKGRAINYIIENKVRSEKWYIFLDDDNLLLDDTVMYEIPFYEERGYVACNAIITPRLGKSRFANTMDFTRKFDDITIFRFFTGLLKTPLIGIHGEMLTVKGCILKEIGYNNRSLTEDFRFSIDLVKRKMKTWQSDSRVSIRSANSIHDLLRQRGRWFKGIAQDFKFCSTPMKAIEGLRLASWMLGMFGSWALSPLWLVWDMHNAIYFIFSGLYPWIILIYSIIKSKTPPYYILMIPVYGFIESISFLYGLTNKKFFVVDKN
jgi:cellulose synthase/poly-beta-1,6-N-acetylglucosamine synthase-like glycosyltransferase